MKTVALLGAALLALGFAYREALTAMVRLWNASPMYSYGFTVPFVSGYLIWERRHRVAELSPRPSWAAGGAVLTVGLLLAVAGRAGGIQVVEQCAFIVSLTGATLLLLGTAYVRVIWASLAYLLLMIPLWDGLTEHLHESFQQRSAGMGIWILHSLGIPAHRDGTFITLPNLQIEVARACSGVNYLVAVLALGLPLCYVLLHDNWRRAVLLASAILVAAASNGLRVALICVLAYYDVGAALHGPFHVLHGLFVAGIGYVALFAGLRILASRQETPASAQVGGPLLLARDGDLKLSGFAVAVVIGLFVLLGSNVVAWEPRPIGLEPTANALPHILGEWRGEMRPLSFDHTRSPRSLWPDPDTEFRRRYRRADGTAVDVHIAYYAWQRQSHEIVTHRITELHNRARRLNIRMASGRMFPANVAPPDRSGVETLFWYEIDATPEANRYFVKIRTLWNSALRARSNGAAVMLTTRSEGSRSRIEALQGLGGLVREALAAELARVGHTAAR